MLHVSGLQIAYGAVVAGRDINLPVHHSEIVSLIGANGAGKFSTLRAISGLVKPRAGTIAFEGQEITGLRPDLITGRGLIQVPEGRAVLARMTVLENLQMGTYVRRDSDVEADRHLRLGQ